MVCIPCEWNGGPLRAVNPFILLFEPERGAEHYDIAFSGRQGLFSLVGMRAFPIRSAPC